jgi:DUF4097 and DUF4098 domain-containing protein YvlB
MKLELRKVFRGAIFGALFVGLTGGASAATVSKEFSFEADSRIAVENLVGSVRVRPTDGSVAIVKATVVAESDALAEAVNFEMTNQGSLQQLDVIYPEDNRDIFYDALSKGSRSNVRYRGKKYKITGNDSRGAVALRVDLEVFLPAGSRMDKLKNLVGEVDLAKVAADIRVDVGSGQITSVDGKGTLELDTGSGRVNVSSHEGSVEVDTGSGAVEIVTVLGAVNVDTGSGTVKISGVSGNATADTGSGSVEFSEIIGDKISADTGSGSVKGRALRGSFSADTGSGSVRVDGIADSDSIDIDTGSGSIRIKGDFSGLRRLKLDTGSGDVDVQMLAAPDMTVRIEVSSGDIEVDVPDMKTSKVSRHRLETMFGDGSGQGVIGTGSGDVEIHMVKN